MGRRCNHNCPRSQDRRRCLPASQGDRIRPRQGRGTWRLSRVPRNRSRKRSRQHSNKATSSGYIPDRTQGFVGMVSKTYMFHKFLYPTIVRGGVSHKYQIRPKTNSCIQSQSFTLHSHETLNQKSRVNKTKTSIAHNSKLASLQNTYVPPQSIDPAGSIPTDATPR